MNIWNSYSFALKTEIYFVKWTLVQFLFLLLYSCFWSWFCNLNCFDDFSWQASTGDVNQSESVVGGAWSNDYQLININYNIKMLNCWTRGVLSSPWRPLSPLSVSTSRLSSLNTGPGLDPNYLWCHESFWLARLWQQNCSIEKLKHSTAGTRRRRQFGPDQHVQLHYRSDTRRTITHLYINSVIKAQQLTVLTRLMDQIRWWTQHLDWSAAVQLAVTQLQPDPPLHCVSNPVC